MALFFEILGFALFVFWLLLIARVVVEFIRSFSRDWRPKGVTVVLEVIMTVTDPPVKLLRRIIPQLTIGAIRFDLSIMGCCWWPSSACSWPSAPRPDPAPQAPD